MDFWFVCANRGMSYYVRPLQEVNSFIIVIVLNVNHLVVFNFSVG